MKKKEEEGEGQTGPLILHTSYFILYDSPLDWAGMNH